MGIPWYKQIDKIIKWWFCGIFKGHEFGLNGNCKKCAIYIYAVHALGSKEMNKWNTRRRQAGLEVYSKDGE